MPTKIKRGQRLLIPFKNGVSIYDSQNKPRMYLTQMAFERSFPGHLINREGVELVEYAEVVRCWECKHIHEAHYEKPGEPPYTKYTCGCKYGLTKSYAVDKYDFCSRGEKKDGDEVNA